MIRAAALAAAALLAFPASASEPVTGRWITQDGKAVVVIGRCGAMLCGKVERLLKDEPGRPTTDVANPDPALRTRPYIGLEILSGFVDDGTVWQGQIYDPRTGRTYRSELSRDGASLQVRGCIAIFCRTQTWTKAG